MKLFIIILLLINSLIGGVIVENTLYLNPNNKSSSKILIPKSVDSNTSKKHNENFSLTINTIPADATIKIMNIKPKYKKGMILSLGSYKIEVSKKNYTTKKETIYLESNESITISLMSNTTKELKIVENLNDLIDAQNSIIVEGMAPVATSKIEAKNQALIDAKLRAVEQQIGSYIQSETQMENYEIKYDFIKENIQGYVSKYTILEEKIDNISCYVKIKAVVKKGKIDEDIENLVSILNYKKKPSFTIISKGDSIVSPIFESNLKNTLLRNKINIIDSYKIKNDYNQLIFDQSSKKLIPYKRLGIDYIIHLTTQTQELITDYKGQQHKSVTLFVTADVLNTSNFEIITSKKFPNLSKENRIIVKSDLIPSAEAIAKKFSKALLIDIIDKWNDSLNNGENTYITIKGLRSYKMMEQLKDYFKKNITNIKDIYSKEYSKESTVFNVTIQGGLTHFIDELIMNNNKYNIEILSQDSNKCTLSIH